MRLECWLKLLRQNDRHHGVAGVDFYFRKRWPPPLPCMAWLLGFLAFLVVVFLTGGRKSLYKVGKFLVG
jgi:hypothetical protein